MTKKKNLTWGLTFIATVIIPILVFASGYVPDFALKDDVRLLNLDQLELRQEYLNDKYLTTKKNRRQLQQEIYQLEQTAKPVPDFYHKELEETDQDIDKLELRLDETQRSKEALKSTE